MVLGLYLAQTIISTSVAGLHAIAGLSAPRALYPYRVIFTAFAGFMSALAASVVGQTMYGEIDVGLIGYLMVWAGTGVSTAFLFSQIAETLEHKFKVSVAAWAAVFLGFLFLLPTILYPVTSNFQYFTWACAVLSWAAGALILMVPVMRHDSQEKINYFHPYEGLSVAQYAMAVYAAILAIVFALIYVLSPAVSDSFALDKERIAVSVMLIVLSVSNVAVQTTAFRDGWFGTATAYIVRGKSVAYRAGGQLPEGSRKRRY